MQLMPLIRIFKYVFFFQSLNRRMFYSLVASSFLLEAPQSDPPGKASLRYRVALIHGYVSGCALLHFRASFGLLLDDLH